MTLGKTQEKGTAFRDSAAQLAALGILAYAASTLTHKALGHAVYCVAAGGHNVMLSAREERCSFPKAPPLGIKAAGPGVQLIAGLLVWLALHLLTAKLPARGVSLRYFLWLYMVFNLFIASSYVALSGLTEFGDAAALIAGAQPHVIWRTGLVLLGSMVYLLSIMATAMELRQFSGPEDERGRVDRLVWIPYVSAGIFACCTAALNKAMGRGAAMELASLSSFGSGAGLFCLPEAQRGMAGKPAHAAYLRWSAAWFIAAGLVVAVFLFLVGPGLR